MLPRSVGALYFASPQIEAVERPHMPLFIDFHPTAITIVIPKAKCIRLACPGSQPHHSICTQMSICALSSAPCFSIGCPLTTFADSTLPSRRQSQAE